MKGVQLKLQGEWLVMPPGFSIKLQQLNPVFNEEGVFSFPFEVPIEPNRHLFKNISDPFGNVKLKDIDGMEAELWFNGVLLYRGIIETEQEIEFGDTIPMTFLSGNSDFLSKLDGMNAQDVPLDREIKLGYLVTNAIAPWNAEGTRDISIPLPPVIMMNYTEYNVSSPYPSREFCNVRVCTSDENGNYKKLEAKRPYSGVCFYVLYFLDCVFKHLDVSVRNNSLTTVEDMCRLAFFTTKCDSYLSETERSIPLNDIKDDQFCGKDFTLIYHRNRTGRDYGQHIETAGFRYKGKDIFATNKNFPAIQVEELFSDLEAAFGIKMVYDTRSNNIDLIYVKDILSDTSCLSLDAMILSVISKRSKDEPIRLTYGVSDDLSFNYDDYKNVQVLPDYESVLSQTLSAYDKTCYVDQKTGNAYRVKVNKETGGDASLFEVGGFRDYESEQNETADFQDSNIGFKPILVNDISGGNRVRSSERFLENRTTTMTEGYGKQILAIFADVELNSSTLFDGKIKENYEDDRRSYVLSYVYLKSIFQENYDFKENDQSPLQNYDAGYSLGIMRGAGSSSSIEYTPNYDGEGNNSWVQTVSNYAFTSDSCDNYGRFFDYNGTEAGGADQSGRFSLKLIARKDDFPIDSSYSNRGLVDKFLSEYVYFMANKKTVIIEVDMNITQLLNINFLKRYRIGDFTGFINRISYTLTEDGIEDIILELYTL